MSASETIGSLQDNPMDLPDTDVLKGWNGGGQCQYPQTSEARAQSSTYRFDGKRRFVLMIMVEADEKCREFIKFCSVNCSRPVIEACQQKNSTLHFTLFANKLLDCDEASNISFCGQRGPDQALLVRPPVVKEESTIVESQKVQSSKSLPDFNLVGLLGWQKTIALATDTKVDEVVDLIKAPFQWKVQKHLHLTLYRMNGFSDEKQRQFKRIHGCVRKMIRKKGDFNYGSAKGVKIILKELGAEYDGSDGRFYRILYEE